MVKPHHRSSMFISRTKKYVCCPFYYEQHKIRDSLILLVIGYLLSAYHVESTELTLTIFWSLFKFYLLFFIFVDDLSWLNWSLSHTDRMLV